MDGLIGRQNVSERIALRKKNLMLPDEGEHCVFNNGSLFVCRILVASSSVKVSEAAVNALAAAVRENSESIDEVSAPFRPPLLFDSVEQEINFISTLSLLSFGTGQ